MKNSIYLRSLILEDAKTSYLWRNNPLIWKYTGRKPLPKITVETETEWLKNAFENKNDHRFAICTTENCKYIGNVQLINVNDESAEYHIFIGDISYWGKGVGKQATHLMLKYGFNHLKLAFITLQVHESNSSAKSLYQKLGFIECGITGNFIDMTLTNKRFNDLWAKTNQEIEAPVYSNIKVLSV